VSRARGAVDISAAESPAIAQNFPATERRTRSPPRNMSVEAHAYHIFCRRAWMAALRGGEKWRAAAVPVAAGSRSCEVEMGVPDAIWLLMVFCREACRRRLLQWQQVPAPRAAADARAALLLLRPTLHGALPRPPQPPAQFFAHLPFVCLIFMRQNAAYVSARWRVMPRELYIW